MKSGPFNCKTKIARLLEVPVLLSVLCRLWALPGHVACVHWNGLAGGCLRNDPIVIHWTCGKTSLTCDQVASLL